MSEALIKIEVVYALPGRQEIIALEVPGGATVQLAIEQSGLLSRYPEIDLKKQKVGIFSKLSKLDSVLRDRDRIEIYRPLIADPKAVRKQRAEEGKTMKKGASENAPAEDSTPAD